MVGFLAKFTLMGALTASVTGEESLVTDSEGRRTATTCTTSHVRVWTIRVYEGVRGKTYTVRWRVGGRDFSKTHKSKPVATKQRSELSRAVRTGILFDIYTGLPLTEPRQAAVDSTWYDHAVAFTVMKWLTLQPGSRRDLAAGLATVPMALTSRQRGRPGQEQCFNALAHWSFNQTARKAGEPSPHLAAAADWIRSHSLKVSDLNNPPTLRIACDATIAPPGGKPYAHDTHRNKMKALAGAIKYAVELGLLERNPPQVNQHVAAAHGCHVGPPGRGEPGAGTQAHRSRRRHRVDRPALRGLLRGDLLRGAAAWRGPGPPGTAGSSYAPTEATSNTARSRRSGPARGRQPSPTSSSTRRSGSARTTFGTPACRRG